MFKGITSQVWWRCKRRHHLQNLFQASSYSPPFTLLYSFCLFFNNSISSGIYLTVATQVSYSKSEHLFPSSSSQMYPTFPFSYKLSFLFPVGLINSNMQGTPRDPFLINSRECLSIIYTSSYHVAQSFHIILGNISPA